MHFATMLVHLLNLEVGSDSSRHIRSGHLYCCDDLGGFREIRSNLAYAAIWSRILAVVQASQSALSAQPSIATQQFQPCQPNTMIMVRDFILQGFMISLILDQAISCRVSCDGFVGS